MEHIIGGKFKLGRKIGGGSFGEIYLGTPDRVIFRLLFSPLTIMEYLYFWQGSLFYSAFVFLLKGVNIQSGEEVAIKLVSLCIFLPSFYFAM